MKHLKVFVLILVLAGVFVVTACSNGADSAISSSGHSFISYKGTKAPNEAKEVGDIVFNDGSATPYTEDLTLTEEQKAAAIAIIFYKGSGLNSDIYNGTYLEGNAKWITGDTTTSRTLGVGLKHASFSWCKSSAIACNTDIKTIQCQSSGSAGSLTFTGYRNGSDNLDKISEFLSDPDNSTSDDTDDSEKYPAFYFAKNYNLTATNLGTAYASGWYLPSIAELFQIYANGKGSSKTFDIDAASRLCGGIRFGSGIYCSSSQYSSADSEPNLYFSTGGCGPGLKQTAYSVCAIREFN